MSCYFWICSKILSPHEVKVISGVFPVSRYKCYCDAITLKDFTNNWWDIFPLERVVPVVIDKLTKTYLKIIRLEKKQKEISSSYEVRLTSQTQTQYYFDSVINFNMMQILFFLKLLFGCPTANFGPLSRRQPHSPMLITYILHIRPEGHWKPHNVVGSLSPAEHLVGFEAGTFQFWSHCLNPLGHSISNKSCVVFF